MKLSKGSFATINRREVLDGDVVVGDVRILRLSGWRGGPIYNFYPNEAEKARALRAQSESTVARLLKKLTTN